MGSAAYGVKNILVSQEEWIKPESSWVPFLPYFKSYIPTRVTLTFAVFPDLPHHKEDRVMLSRTCVGIINMLPEKKDLQSSGSPVHKDMHILENWEWCTRKIKFDFKIKFDDQSKLN